MEWVPTCGLANDLTWAEERSAVALANYVPRITQEVAQIARLGAHRLVSWPADSSMSEEEDEEQEEDEQEEGKEQEEADPEPPITDAEPEQSEEDQEGEQELSRWCSQDWETVMGEEEQLAFDDPRLDCDATADGCFPRRLTPREMGSPMEAAVEVYAWESEVEDL